MKMWILKKGPLFDDTLHFAFVHLRNQLVARLQFVGGSDSLAIETSNAEPTFQDVVGMEQLDFFLQAFQFVLLAL